MNKKGLFIAATGQNVGKTTICLGLVSGLLKKLNKIGFIKPVGQEHVTFDGVKVDKDVVLFKEHFQLPSSVKTMSPVIFDKRFTRDYLDEKISLSEQKKNILDYYKELEEQNDFVVVEGTGHVAVGSIADLNNAIVAKELGLDAICIAEGGIGSSIDKLTLNKDQFEKYGVRVRGVILNKVLPEKRDMVVSYMKKALKKWDIPLIGAIPFNQILSTPSMQDFEMLFDTTLFSGQEGHFSHFKKFSLIACSDSRYEEVIESDQLIITPASREDIILATLSHYWDKKIEQVPFNMGMILTEAIEPSPSIVEQLKKAHIPALYAPISSYEAMEKISGHIAKIQKEDTEKIEAAKKEVEACIDFSLIL